MSFKCCVRGEGLLSPYARVPWTSIVTLAVGVLLVLTGRNENTNPTTEDVARAWIIASIGYAFYLYKIVENMFTTLSPKTWWTYGLYRGSNSERRDPASIWDAVDLGLGANALANGLLVFALYESNPAFFPALSLAASPLERYVELSAMIAFVGFGTGFTRIVPASAWPIFVVYVLAAIQQLVSWVVIASIISVVVGKRQH